MAAGRGGLGKAAARIGDEASGQRADGSARELRGSCGSVEIEVVGCSRKS
jgi:hypothetical protein